MASTEAAGESREKQSEEQPAKEPAKTSANVLEKLTSNSTASLVEALGLAGEDEVSLQRQLKALQGQVARALEELTTITTYDSNLERQYKEVVAENRKLNAELDRARNELRHLRGQLSIIQMTSAEAREEKARAQLRDRKRQEHERMIELQRARGELGVTEEGVYVPTAADRARTVNAKGEYITRRVQNRHNRSSTYPTLPSLSPPRSRQPPSPRRGASTLPPPLVGCGCSECRGKQSLGALTLGGKEGGALGKGLCQKHLTNQITKSGQQVLLGDKVIVKGERLGTVSYIGKLDFDFFDQIYIGVSLDMPVGNSDGALKGRRYFQCSPHHGVFIKPGDVICVTGRKPLTGGTAVPRVREKVPSAILKWSDKQAYEDLLTQQSFSSTVPSIRSESTVQRARNITQAELKALKKRDPYDLVDPSVQEMTERMRVLALKQKQQPIALAKTPPTPTPTEKSATPPADESVPALAATPTPQGIPPQPLPPIPETPPTQEKTTPPRAATPLERTLLEMLSDADLGATGFLKANELRAVLTKLGKLSPEGVTMLLQEVGVDLEDDAVGLPYHQLLPHLLPTLLAT